MFTTGRGLRNSYRGTIGQLDCSSTFEFRFSEMREDDYKLQGAAGGVMLTVRMPKCPKADQGNGRCSAPCQRTPVSASTLNSARCDLSTDLVGATGASRGRRQDRDVAFRLEPIVLEQPTPRQDPPGCVPSLLSCGSALLRSYPSAPACVRRCFRVLRPTLDHKSRLSRKIQMTPSHRSLSSACLFAVPDARYHHD